MPEVLTSTDEFFDSSEFGQHFTEWQRARIIHDERASQFRSHLNDAYADSGWSGYDLETQVDYLMGLSDEDLEERGGPLDDYELALRQLWFDAELKESAANDALVNYSRTFGVSQFATYGLWLHLRETPLITRTDLKTKTQKAEADFQRVDDLVRSNPGEILTIVDLGVAMGRLGVGGIALTDGSKVQFPIATDSRVYMSSFSKEMPDVYVEDKLTIDAHQIHSISGSEKVTVLDNPNELLSVDSVVTRLGSRGLLLAIGDLPEGPMYIGDRQDDGFFRYSVGVKIRNLGYAAAYGVVS